MKLEKDFANSGIDDIFLPMVNRDNDDEVPKWMVLMLLLQILLVAGI